MVSVPVKISEYVPRTSTSPVSGALTGSVTSSAFSLALKMIFTDVFGRPITFLLAYFTPWLSLPDYVIRLVIKPARLRVESEQAFLFFVEPGDDLRRQAARVVPLRTHPWATEEGVNRAARFVGLVLAAGMPEPAIVRDQTPSRCFEIHDFLFERRRV